MRNKLSIDGNDFDDVLGVATAVTRDYTDIGRPSALCNTVEIQVSRECFNDSDAKLFDLFSNGDGTRKLVDGKVEVADERNRTLVTCAFERAFLSNYLLTNNGPDGRTQEHVTIRSGIVTVTSGSDTASLRHETYIHNTQD